MISIFGEHFQIYFDRMASILLFFEYGETKLVLVGGTIWVTSPIWKSNDCVSSQSSDAYTFFSNCCGTETSSAFTLRFLVSCSVAKFEAS